MVASLRQQILNGTYAPESYLPSEKELSKQFELSNKSVRKGLEVLEKEGLIRKTPRVGNKIMPLPPQAVIRFACSRSISRDLRLEQLIADFHRLYPRIQVETVPYFKAVPEVLGKENPAAIDLISANVYQFQGIVKEGLVETLEPLPEPHDTHRFLLAPFRNEGTLYVQPLVFGPVVLCYNKAHFAESGVPEPDGSWTWDCLFNSATALSNGAGRYGFGFHVVSENRWPIFMLQSGGRSEWEAPWESDSLRRKLERNMKICKDILHDRAMSPLYLSQDDKEINRLFLEGKISMILASYMQMNEFIGTDLDYDVSPVPFQHDPATLLISIGAAVNKYSRQKEEALMFLQYLASQRAQEIIQAHSLSLPSFRRLLERPVAGELKRPDRYAMFREIMFTFRTHIDLQFSEGLRQELLRLLKEYWAGMIEEEQLCDLMFTAIRDDRGVKV